MTSSACIPLISEIPSIICGNLHSDRRTLARLARTCRAFEDPALDVLWSNLTQLQHLLQILPPDSWKVETKKREHRMVLLRPVLKQEIDHFMRYAQRVKQFCAKTTRKKIDASVYKGLKTALGDAKLFPGVKSLSWKAGRDDLHLAFQFIEIFLGLHLTAFKYDDISNSGGTENIDVLEKLPVLYPRLKSLTFHWRSPFNNEAQEDEAIMSISKAVQEWHSLETLCIPNLTCSALLAVSRFPNLKRLDVYRFKANESIRSMPKGRFPALRELAIHVEDDILNFIPLLDLLEFSPVKMLKMYFDIAKDLHNSSSWKKVFSAIRDHCSHEKLLTLSVKDVSEYPKLENAEDYPPSNNGDALTFDAISPLLEFYNVHKIHIDVPCGFVLGSGADYKEMATSWTRIKSLIFKLPLYCRSKWYPKAALEDLIPFAEFCPDLKELGLFINVAHSYPKLTDAKPANGISQAVLKVLAVGDSPAYSDSFAIAAFLSSLFPSLTNIHFLRDENLYYYSDSDDGRSGRMSRNYREWSEVGFYAKNISTIRRQERFFYTGQPAGVSLGDSEEDESGEDESDEDESDEYESDSI